MSHHPRFETPSDGTGLDIVDPVETRHFSLRTDEAVAPSDATTDAFEFPVDTACRFSAGRLRIPYMVPVDVRTPDGDPLKSVDSPGAHDLPADDYLVELHSPVKVYLRLSAGVRIDATPESVTFAFDGDATVEVGARSYHSAPAATVTVPDDPEAMMQAVSAFSSALKTTSPERAWPTLRGHPPRVERGDELSIPDGLDAPETGIRITVPSEYWAVYAVAPLAYYLGAEVRPGDHASVTATSGATRYLGDEPTAVADAAAALLKRVFFLDCVVRTEGLYPDDLHEREVLESRVDLDLAGLYDASPADRLAAYLDVPDEAVAAISSPWHRVTHVQPDADAVEFLPYLVNDLSLVRPKVRNGGSPSHDEMDDRLEEAVDAFLRRPGASDRAGASDALVRSTDAAGGLRSGGSDGGEAGADDESDVEGATRGVPELDEYVSLPGVDALEQAWVGDGTPVRGTKLIEDAFVRETPEPSDGTVDVTVVCNDEEMREEWDSVGEIYASRDDLPVDVTAKTGVATDDLRALLAEDHDVFHFVGHIDGHGFQCPDGILDAGTVSETNATTALLNGCRSHDQGVELVKAGAQAAVVSLSDLFNEGAVEVGETLARLLHYGFDVGAAMKIVREYTSIGHRYVVVGDPGVVVAQCDNGLPILHHVVDASEDYVTLEPHVYPDRIRNIGTTLQTYIHDMEYYFLAIGPCSSITMTYDTFQKSVDATAQPLVDDGVLKWSDIWF